MADVYRSISIGRDDDGFWLHLSEPEAAAMVRVYDTGEDITEGDVEFRRVPGGVDVLPGWDDTQHVTGDDVERVRALLTGGA